MEETGPPSCAGTNETSLTHAQALWAVDYTLTLAELGVERVAFHSTLQACRGGAPMSPICASGEIDDPVRVVEGRSSYLALMLLGEIPDGEILPVETRGNDAVSAHAVLDEERQLTLTLIDLRDPAESTNTRARSRSAHRTCSGTERLRAGSSLPVEGSRGAHSTRRGAVCRHLPRSPRKRQEADGAIALR